MFRPGANPGGRLTVEGREAWEEAREVLREKADVGNSFWGRGISL